MKVKPAQLKTFHATMTGVWLVAIVPSVLWWSQSVAWIVFMSVWANLAGHFASWQAARVEVKEDER
jgi:ABC-type lipoprotein release transport system permease subunit